MSNTPRFEVYRDKADEYRWRFVAANGRIMADSGESYTRREDCHDAVARLVELIKATDRTANPTV